MNDKLININNNNRYKLQNELQLRFLCPTDLNEIKELCGQCFPVDYPEAWFVDITSNCKFYSLAAIYKTKIIGMIVAEIKTKSSCEQEDINILSSNHPDNTQVTYILSLGVLEDFRRYGIASILLDTLLSHLKSSTNCKAVYLHVLSTNEIAIRFYEKRNFQKRIYLPKYYTINNQLYDGYCYVLYMNKGHPPWYFTDYVKYICKTMYKLNPFNYIKKRFYFKKLSYNCFWLKNVFNTTATTTTTTTTTSTTTTTNSPIILTTTTTSNNYRNYAGKDFYRIS